MPTFRVVEVTVVQYREMLCWFKNMQVEKFVVSASVAFREGWQQFVVEVAGRPPSIFQIAVFAPEAPKTRTTRAREIWARSA